MKKILKTSIGIIFSCTLFFNNFAVKAEESDSETFSDQILTYEKKNNGDVKIISCNENTTSLVINESIDGYKISEIGSEAFSECMGLKEVELPDSITSIGEGAFAGCSSLKKIKLPSAIDEIPAKAFALCDSL